MDPCRSVGDGGGGGDASRRYLYTPVSITQADNECRLEGDKTHEIFHFLGKKVGGTFPMWSSSSSSSSNTVQGSVLLPHYRTLEVRPGRIS